MIIDNPNEIEQQKIIDILEKECSEIIRIYRKSKRFFYRGIRSNFVFLKKQYPRKRKPMNIDNLISQLVDSALDDIGMNAKRENSVFVTSSQSQALSYGNLYLFFPKNNFSFTYSKKINDLFLDLKKIYNDSRFNRYGVIFFKDMPYHITIDEDIFFDKLKNEIIDFLKTRKYKKYFLLLKEIKNSKNLYDLIQTVKKNYFFYELYNFVEQYLKNNTISFEQSDYLKKIFKNIIKSIYKNDNIYEALLLSNEVMFTNDYYYCLTYDYVEYYNILNKWIKSFF